MAGDRNSSDYAQSLDYDYDYDYDRNSSDYAQPPDYDYDYGKPLNYDYDYGKPLNYDYDHYARNHECDLSEDTLQTFITAIACVMMAFIIIGTVGNVLTVTALLRMKGPTPSIGILLGSLAVSDTVILYSHGLSHWVFYVYQINIPGQSPVLCPIYMFMEFASTTLSSWLLVFISAERFISVHWPHRASTICTRRNTVIAVSVLLLTISLTSIPMASMFSVSPGYDRCGATLGTIQYTTGLTHVLVTFLLPFAIASMANIAIIYRLVQMKRTHLTGSASSRRANKMTRSCVLLVLVTLQFLCFLGPRYMYELLTFHATKSLYTSNPCSVLYHSLAYDVMFVLVIGNAACNIFSYVLSGGRFRKEVIQLVGYMMSPCKRAIQRRCLRADTREPDLETEEPSTIAGTHSGYYR